MPLHEMAANDWYRMTGNDWAMMGGCLVVAALLALFIEWVGRPRRNKWNDWRRK
jgi:hypothetical protein